MRRAGGGAGGRRQFGRPGGGLSGEPGRQGLAAGARARPGREHVALSRRPHRRAAECRGPDPDHRSPVWKGRTACSRRSAGARGARARRSGAPIRHLFLFIGAEPNTDWLSGSGVALDAKGFVRDRRRHRPTADSLETSRRAFLPSATCGRVRSSASPQQSAKAHRWWQRCMPFWLRPAASRLPWHKEIGMHRALLGVFLAVSLALPAAARVEPYPRSFRIMDVSVDGAVIHVRVGGKGPAVLMLHGFGDTGDMWAPLARRSRARSHGGRARSARHGPLVPPRRAATTRRPRRDDMAQVLDRAQDRQGRSGHARYRQHGRLCLRRAVSRPRDALGGDGCAAAGHRPLGRDHSSNPKLWHFNFRGPDVERLVAGPRAHLSRPLLERAFRRPARRSTRRRASITPSSTRSPQRDA